MLPLPLLPPNTHLCTLKVEQLTHFSIHRSVLCVFQRIAEADIVFSNAYLIAESEDVPQADPIYDLRRSATEYLLGKDVIQPLGIIGVQRLHALALIEPCHDLRHIHSRLHIEVGKCRIGIVKAAGVFLLQPVHHVLHDLFRREYLVRALGRNEIKDISLVVWLKIVRKLGTFFHKLLHGIVEHDLVKQVPVKVLLLAAFRYIVACLLYTSDAADD